VVTKQTDDDRTRRATEAVERNEQEKKDRHRQEWILNTLNTLVEREVKGEPVTTDTLPPGLFTALRDTLREQYQQNRQPRPLRIKQHEFSDGYTDTKAKRVWMHKHRREMVRLDQLRNLVVASAKHERIVTWHANRGHYYGALALSASFLGELWQVAKPTALKTIRFLERNGYCVKRSRALYGRTEGRDGQATGRPLGAVYLFGRRTVIGGPLVPGWSWIAPATKVVPETSDEVYPAGPLPEWTGEVEQLADGEVYVPTLDDADHVVAARLKGVEGVR